MTDNKNIVAYEIGEDVVIENLVKKEGNTNQFYVGHLNNIPVFKNLKLPRTETKIIMKNQKRFELKPGNYTGYVVQIYDKINEKEPTKKFKIIQIEIKDQPDDIFVTFFVEGYSEKCCAIAHEKLENIKTEFGLDKIEDLVNREVNVYVSQNGEYTDYHINKQKKYVAGGDYACEIPHSKLIKVIVNKEHTKAIGYVKVPLKDDIYDETISGNLNDKVGKEIFDDFCHKGNIELNKDINIEGVFKVFKTPDKTNPEKIGTNKRFQLPKSPNTRKRHF